MSTKLEIVGATPTALVLPPKTTFEEWGEIGRQLTGLEKSVMWWMGDWCHFGERGYGDLAKVALESDYAHQTWKHAASVSGKIERCRRRHLLSWSHHAEIASLPPAQQDALLDEAEEKGWSVRDIRKAAARIKRTDTAPDPIEGKYDCIVVDPPWPMEKIVREVRPNQREFAYEVMDEDDLVQFGHDEIEPCMADDCHVFMWTTHKFLPMGLRLLEAWGLKYVLTMVWHKNGGFQPVGLPQYNCEFALYGRKGAPKFVTTKDFPTCFTAPRREHSRKPDEFYDTVRRVCGGRRIEIFGRGARLGFDAYGFETGKFDGSE